MARNRNVLAVWMNGRKVGRLIRETNSGLEFQYDSSWLDWSHAMPVSLSMPLREEGYRGGVIATVFDNLLPDSVDIRRHLAERNRAEGTDAFSLLDAIGRDCVGALQFVGEGADPGDSTAIQGHPISSTDIEKIIRDLRRTPLGVGPETGFRISIAGVQEKTALLRRGDQWEIPNGATATTHILKPAIGLLPNGLDLTQSVENEHFCLTFLASLGLPVARSEIATFGETRVLVVERFDRLVSGDRLIRLPQEDMCQALQVPWSQKYEDAGGPGIQSILSLLKASDQAGPDRKQFIAAQLLFWLLGATDGHAKNFSIHLMPAGHFYLAPFYDVVSVQPNVDMNQIQPKEFRLAMAVGENRHYRVNEIVPRHYYQMADKAGLPKSDLDEAFAWLQNSVPSALGYAIAAMPPGFPVQLARSIAGGVTRRLRLVT
jgi:serine/threonine-protein kinase HipA